ncbi:uncharacterized protein isoform X4 [Leptinotarsa decemlineata]|uniref:uncharacterized protein isoform X4 n=1 Tax=Leptinotarsa decemlineata TaxID=7539 RepID=UPI003D308DE8
MVWIVVLLMTCSLSSVRLAHIQEKDFGEILRPASKIWHNKCILITGTTEEQIKELQQGKFTGNENIKITTDITVDEKKVKYFVPDNLQYKLPHYIDCLSAAKISVPNNATEQLWYTVQCAYKKDTERFLIF